MATPLHGLRVLDFGWYLSGPLAGVFLADQGADVIAIPHPFAPVWDPIAEQTLARGKRLHSVDLKSSEGLAYVQNLAQSCDVIIENFRPGVMDRLGIGYEAVRGTNPGVVYVSMPGYSRHDPRSQQQVWDSAASAASGLMTDSSLGGASLGLPPTHTPLPLPSVYTGIWGALAAVAGVYGRLEHGRGDHVEVPLMDAVMSSAAGLICMLEDQPARYNSSPLPSKAIEAMAKVRTPDRLAGKLHSLSRHMMPPLFRNYTCKDGDQLLICAIDNVNQIDKLLSVTGINAEKLGFAHGDVFDLPASKNNINAYRGASSRWKRLRRALQDTFSTDTAQVWAERLSKAGVPATRPCTIDEWVQIPAMTESHVVIADERVGTRPVYQPGPQVDIGGHDVATSPNPLLRELNLERTRWAVDRTFPPATTQKQTGDLGAPLRGVSVVDLANVIAGPSAGRTLAELGADVLHINAPNPRMGPRQTLQFGLEVNRGKRDLICDLETSQGREILCKLMPQTDVLLYNKVPRQADRLGISPQQVHGLNEQTIITAITAYSGVVAGAWDDRPGYDPIVQALSGIMRRYGGPDGPQVHGMASCIDYFTGFAGAFATVVALLARRRGHTHLTARTSLARTAGWIQLPFLGNPTNDVAPSMTYRGANPLDRIYRARDGWVQITAPTRQWDKARLTNPDMPRLGNKVGSWLANRIRALDTDTAVTWANEIGLTGQRVYTAPELRRTATRAPAPGELSDPRAPSATVQVECHPGGDRYILPASSWLRPSKGRRQLAAAPRPGQHTREVLADLAYDTADIDLLIADGIVAEKWFDASGYLPS